MQFCDMKKLLFSHHLGHSGTFLRHQTLNHKNLSLYAVLPCQAFIQPYD